MRVFGPSEKRVSGIAHFELTNGHLQLALERRALVLWWHSFDEEAPPAFKDLFEYLLVNADVWHRPLRTKGDAEEEEEEEEPHFTPASLEWRVVAPGSAMFTAADPFFNYSPPAAAPRRKRKRAELADEEDEEADIPRTPPRHNKAGSALCESCHRLPRPPKSLVCAACRLAFGSEGITPPGYVRNRSKMLRPACSECQAKPARKGASKCEGCAYAASTTACVSCAITGVKITKGLCPVCFKRASKAARASGEDTTRTRGRREEDTAGTDSI